MRKFTVLVAVLALAATCSAADAAKKARKRVAAAPPPPAQNANPNANTARFLRDAVPVILPSWAIPLYLTQQREGPHAYPYYQHWGQPQPTAAPAPRKVRRVRHARQST